MYLFKKKSIFFILFSLLFFNVNASQCNLLSLSIDKIENNTAWVWTKNNDYVIKILDTKIDDKDHVWYGGPIIIQNREGGVVCKAKIELLEQPFMLAGDRYFYYLSGDSVYVSLNVIDINTCKISWKSKDYYRDNAPILVELDSSLRISKKIVRIGENCLPVMATVK